MKKYAFCATGSVLVATPPPPRRVVCRRVARGRRQVARPVLPRRLVA